MVSGGLWGGPDKMQQAGLATKKREGSAEFDLSMDGTCTASAPAHYLVAATFYPLPNGTAVLLALRLLEVYEKYMKRRVVPSPSGQWSQGGGGHCIRTPPVPATAQGAPGPSLTHRPLAGGLRSGRDLLPRTPAKTRCGHATMPEMGELKQDSAAHRPVHFSLLCAKRKRRADSAHLGAQSHLWRDQGMYRAMNLGSGSSRGTDSRRGRDTGRGTGREGQNMCSDRGWGL